MRRALGPTIVLFAIMAAHGILETARDALFLAKLGPDRLAWAYLAIAATALAAVTALRRWGNLRDPRRLTVMFLVMAVLGTTAIARMIATTPSLVFVLYVWTGLVATLVVPAFWTTIDRSLRIAEAKRVFSVIGAGGIVGAMVGSAIAGLLGRVAPAHLLVTVGAIAFGLATLAALVLAPRPLPEVAPPRPTINAPQAPRHYVRWMIALGVVSTVALTLGDLVFKRVLAERFAPEDLASAFGAIYTGLNVIGLAIQLVVTPRLLARLGVGGAIVVLPLILVATATGFAMTGALIAIVALKLGDGGLRHSLHRVLSEILYMPIPAAIRDRAKPIADAIAQRGGQAAAVLVVFALASVDDSAHALATASAMAAVAWLGTTVVVRRAYAHQFRDMLRVGGIHRDARLPELDATSIQMLSEVLSSPDAAEAMPALELLGARGRLPALVLYHPSELVVRRALSLFADDLRPEIGRVLVHLFDHDDVQIRAAAIAAAGHAGYHAKRVVAALADPSTEVRAAALVACAAMPEHADTVAAGTAALLRGSLGDRVALARAIAFAPHERFRDLLRELLARREPAVMREVLALLARAPEYADLDQLVALLENPYVRGDVRRVLVASCHTGLDHLIAALDDPRTPLGVRRHIPRTISRFRARAAAAALTARLPREPDGTTEYKILRALGRMAADNPHLPVDAATIRRYARRCIADAARYTTLAERLAAEPAARSSPSGELLGELLAEKRRYAIEHVFRALGILAPTSNLRGVHDALASEDGDRRAVAREILEHVVRADLRGPLLAVLDDLPGDVRRDRLGDLAAGPFASYDAFVGDLLDDPSESLRCIAAHHVAERRLWSLRPALTRVHALVDPPFVVQAFRQAIARLDA